VTLGIVAYFGTVGYYAYQAARRSSGVWFDPSISQIVYETSFIGGLVLLVGLLITASIAPRLAQAPTRAGLAARIRAHTEPEGTRRTGEHRLRRSADSSDAEWEEFEALFDSPSNLGDLHDQLDTDRVQDAASVSAALSRLLQQEGGPAAAGSLSERLAEIRTRSSAHLVSEGKETAKVLLRLVDDMKPLLTAATKAGLNIPEVRKLVAEAMAGRDSDLAQRVRVVEQVKGALEAALVERIAENLQAVVIDIERTKSATHHVHNAELSAAEAVALLDTGNYAAAMERAAAARQIVEQHAGVIPSRQEAFAGRSSFAALTGPSFAAVAYVAISAMMLPGVTGFLQTNYAFNTGMILGLSYGWLGLLAYVFLSVYMVLRLPPSPARSEQSTDRDPNEW
jgi:hypothetical protein